MIRHIAIHPLALLAMTAVAPLRATAFVELLPPTPSVQSSFGALVTVDGGSVIVAAPTDEEAEVINGVPVPRKRWSIHVYDAASGALVRTIRDPVPLSENGGYVSALFAARGLIAVFDSYRRNLLIFETATGNLVRQESGATPLAMDADRLLVSGATRVPALQDVRSGQQLAVYPDPSGVDTSAFGAGAALSEERVLIGAQCGRTGCPGNAAAAAGAAYLFAASTGELLRTFVNPVVLLGDFFGTRVAFFGDDILVASAFAQGPGTTSGMYLLDSDTGAALATFRNPGICALAPLGDLMTISSHNKVSLFDHAGNLKGLYVPPEGGGGDLGPVDDLCAMASEGPVLAVGDSSAVQGNPRIDKTNTRWGFAAVLHREDFALFPETSCGDALATELCDGTTSPSEVALRSRKNPITMTLPPVTESRLKYRAVGLSAAAGGALVNATAVRKGRLRSGKPTLVRMTLTRAGWKQLSEAGVTTIVLEATVTRRSTPVARITRTIQVERAESGGSRGE